MKIKIIVDETAQPPSEFNFSLIEVYRNPLGDNLYFLCDIKGSQYAAISLQSGNRWMNPMDTKEKAVEGLDFVGIIECFIINPSK